MDFSRDNIVDKRIKVRHLATIKYGWTKCVTKGPNLWLVMGALCGLGVW